MSCQRPVDLSTTCQLHSSLVSTGVPVVNLNDLNPCQWMATEAYQLHPSFKLVRGQPSGIGGGWERIYSNIDTQPIDSGFVQIRACVRYVMHCVATGEQRVLGMNPSAVTQLTEAGYVSLITPFLAAAPALNGIKLFALEFFGQKLSALVPDRQFSGSTAYYRAYHKTSL